MMFKFAKSISMTGAATLALLAWAPANAQGLQVVSTFSIISDFASHVGGDRIMLTTLVPANGDAHSYEPKPTDAIAVGKADLVLANGLHFEGFLDRLIQATSAKAPVILLTQGVRPAVPGTTGHQHWIRGLRGWRGLADSADQGAQGVGHLC